MTRFVSFLFALMAFLTPWFIGGNYPFTRTVLVGGCGLALLLVFLELLNEYRSGIHNNRSIPWIWWLLLLGVGFTALQAAPQSASLQSQFGLRGGADSIVEDGLRPLGDSSVAKPKLVDESRPISAYAPATRSKLVDLLYGVGLFIAASLVLRDPRSILPVLSSVAVVGVLVSFVGVLQILSGDPRLLWQYELLWGGSPYASFVNGNNAAGFLLICFSACMFFVAKMVLTFGHQATVGEGGSGFSFKKMLRSISQLQSHHLYFLTGIVVISAGVLMTGSRGGMLALVVCVGFAGLMLSRSNLLAAVGLTIVLVAGAVVVVGYSEQAERVSEDIETLTDFSGAAAPRLQHWQDAVPYGISNVLLGTGNGTYRYLSPGFQNIFTIKTFAHAENVYIETLVEMGGFGVLLLLLCILYCVYACISLYRRNEIFDQALAVCGISCLSGQVAIAVLDFGIYQPANCTAMALMMAVVVGRHSTPNATRTLSLSKKTFSSFIKLAVVSVLGLATCWAGYESFGIELGRSAKRSIKLLNRYGASGPNKTRQVSLPAVKNQLEQAEKIRPDDSGLQLLIGDLEVSSYRLERFAQMSSDVRAELASLTDLDITSSERKLRREQLETFDSETIWNSTALALLHQQLRSSQRFAPETAEEILELPIVKQHLSEAYTRFHQADELCPRLANTRVRLAQLAAFRSNGNPEETLKEEKEHIEAALSRAIPKTQVLFNCGLLALNSGKQDLAVELWKKCLAQPHLYIHERAIVELCLQMLPMKLLYEEVLPQNPKYLLKISRRYMRSRDMILPKKFFVVHIRRLISETAGLEELEENLLLADAAQQINDYPEVVKHYQSVLLLASLQASLRYDYAYALFKTKQFDEAVRQLKVCELDPSFSINRTKQLLGRIRRERSNQYRK